MNDSPRTDLQVFDFDKEEELAQSEIDEKRLAKFNSPILDPQSLANHDAQVGKVDVKNAAIITCVDVDAVDVNLDLEKGGSDPPLDPGENVIDCKDKNSELEAAKQSNSINHQNYCHFKIDIHKHNEPEMKDTSGSGSPEASQIDPSGSSSSNESVDVNSEADECMNESAPTSPDSDIAENVSLNGCGLNGSDIFDMDAANTEVVLHPDYVIYQANYYMGPKLTFSSCCMKINASTTCIKQGAFDLEWAVDDLIDIKCQWFQSSGTVIIKLRVISSNASQSNHVSSTSGIEELEIAVVDCNWSLRYKQITSLNMKYMAIWSIVLHTDVEGKGNDSQESRNYFPSFDKPFDEVIYPKGDPDAVSLSKRDVDLLQPDTFINDTIIDFYIQYLKNKIQEEEKPRFHFFNSFFFRKLADMDKNPSSASDGKAAFLRVRKWTRKVNLFEKDYIFIPVNFNLHWSLIVICHPGEVVNFNGKELDKSLKVPCILHMDSIKGSHSGLKNLVQSYLWEEWKERHRDTLEDDLSSKFSTMRFLPLALPQQENSYDCGLFLLHYLELFLAQAPSNFNPFKLTKFSNFLNVDWFLPAEAYLKRTLIQRLIFELVDNHGSHEISSSDCSDDDNICIENNDNRTGIQHPQLNRESTNSHAGPGIEITLLSASTSLDPQSFNNSGLVLKELFEPGASAGTLVGQCQSFDQRSADYRFNGSVFSMEEDADLGEQLMYLTSDPNFQQVAGVTPQSCSLPYLSRNCGDDACHRPEISLHAEQNMAESSLDASSGGSDDSEEDIGVVENCPVGNDAGSCDEGELGAMDCSPIENPEQLTDISVSDGNNLPITFVPGISQDLNTECDGNLSDLKVTCDDGQVTDHKVTHDDGQVTEDKVTCDGQVTEDKVTRDDGQMTDDKVTHDDGQMTDDKVTGDDGQLTDDKVTGDDGGQMTEDKVTGDDGQVTEDKVTGDDGQVTEDKVTGDDGGQMTEDKVTHDDGQLTEDKVTGDDGQVTDDKVTCDDGQLTEDKITGDGGQVTEDKVTCDDGQMIDGMVPDVCEEEQAAKRRRLMPLQSGSEETLKISNL